MELEHSVIAKLMTGFAKVSNATGGTNLEFNGNARHFTLTRANLKLTHFNGEVSKALVDDDITALDTLVNNDIVTVPKSTFVGALPWTTKIDSVVEIEGMREVHVDDKDAIASQGNFYTDATNLYFIVAANDLLDLDDAKLSSLTLLSRRTLPLIGSSPSTTQRLTQVHRLILRA